MRYLFAVLLLSGVPLAQQLQIDSTPADSRGSFYVDGIAYQYITAGNYTVVAAAHSVINRKFAGVKVRVYNMSQHSITVKAEDVLVEDAVAGKGLQPVSGAELANRMRKPYNMARYAVGNNPGDDATGMPLTSDMLNPQLLEMMRAIGARTRSHGAAGDNLLYTDSPGALEEQEGSGTLARCDLLCHLRMTETREADPLAQLQRQTSPDYVEQCGLRANTVPPRGNVGGVLYFSLGKLSEMSPSAAHGKKQRRVRIKVPIDGENFEFVLPVE